ncbi:MAG: GNAT family N-acetyltransferase [Geminicoccaceae bacterium]|jgi:ribosomal protein S18 acetylase RimI-like enzyme|nr:GNAT family N-acetyltransferase [Geminicoccaceae bacterium]HRY23037.1 GNAT family N-acetyltransferase [Geminicoccaceae bacterium]
MSNAAFGRPDLRRARPADLDRLVELERLFPGDRLSRRALRHHLRNPKAHMIVSDRAGRVVGYALLLCPSRSSWWRLYSIVRAEGEAPPGTGHALVQAALEAARRAGARGIRLEVRADNQKAIKLYESSGFRLFGTRPGYYEDGATALRMALDFHGQEDVGLADRRRPQG